MHLDEYQNKLDNLSSFNESLLEDKSKLQADLEGAKTRLSDADVRKHSPNCHDWYSTCLENLFVKKLLDLPVVHGLTMWW